MKKHGKNNEYIEKKQIKKLFIWALIAAMACMLTGMSALAYLFVPRDGDAIIITVPSFVGVSEENIGLHSGLEIKREWVYSDDVQRGVVVSQEPYAYARRKQRAGEACEVTVYISLGERSEEIPDLSGVEYLSAAAALRSIGARVRSVSVYGDGDDGTVIGTSPSFGEKICDGQTVTVFVNRRRVDEPVSIPDFCGMDASDAVRLALSLGLFVSDGELDGEIVAQSIPARSKVKKGSYISFKTEAVREREWPPVFEKRKLNGWKNN